MKVSYLVLLTIVAFLSTEHIALSQIDSLQFTNGDLIVGEIKSMEKGVLVIKTKYSDSDFKIEWKKVVWLRTQSHFLITKDDDTKYYSNIHSLNDSIVRVIASSGVYVSCNIQDIVYLSPFEDKFKDKFKAEISLGFDMAKSNNLRTFSSRSFIGYKTEKWSSDLTYNTLISEQDSSDKIQRMDGGLNFRYVLFKRWYAIGTVSGLSNTEQKLDLRLNAQLGLGRFILRTNKAYWGAQLGANRNVEQYSNDSETRLTWEGFLGTELNLYDIGDLNLIVSLIVYPSITEVGRLRSDVKFDLKYDLPLDFFIKLGTSINYDNQPVQDASELDYVLHTGFGWEWN